MTSPRQCFSKKCGRLLLFIIIICISMQITVGENGKLLSENFIDQLESFSISNNASRECITQIRILSDSLKSGEMWAFKMLDAWAKLPSGILYGHRMEMGNFEECVDITSPLIGKYCQANIPFESSVIGVSVQLEMGICAPSKCTTDDLNVLLKEVLANLYNISFNATTNLLIASTCSTREYVEFELLDWVAIGLSILLAVLMALSTFYHYVCTYKGRLPNKLFISFSIPKNLQQLLKIQHGHIPCLHGIRCLSLFWIIFIHCYLYLILSPNINSVDIQSWEHTPFAMIEESGVIAVDSFFFLSGLLIIMGALREMNNNMGKLNVPIMYIHRYLRLTPILAVTILFYMTLLNYIDNGPIWKSLTSANKMCDNTWWATLLYVQNYAAPGKMCLGHTWYLAVDTQLFLLSPIFLILIWKWRKVGIAVAVIFGLLLVSFLFTIIMINGYTIYDIVRTYGTATAAMPKIYYSTHTRCSPWIVGFIFGYYLHCNNGRISRIPSWLVTVGWFTSLVMLFALVFAWYPKTLPNTGGPTVLESAFYLAVGRVAWPIALSWIVYACINGYGGVINTFLSWTFWQPISKLSYSMYLWHLIVITINAARQRNNSYFSDYDVILGYWSNFGITLIVCLCVYLAVEAPIADIESYLLPRNIPKTNKQATQETSTVAIAISQQNLCE